MRTCVASPALNLLVCSAAAALVAAPKPTLAGEPSSKGDERIVSLFDGKSLGKWKPTSFGGEGEVRVDEGRILLEVGNDLTGVTWTGKYPKWNYEIALEAMRVDGRDFFCGLTFPVGESFCSLIVGGWGGGVVGLSSLDGHDASENETTSYHEFKTNQWYRVRIRVEKGRIQAWIDDERVVDVDTTGKRISTRVEVEPSEPLGVASWRTSAALRKITLRSL